MSNKSRSGLMVIAGGYLVYLGIKLMIDIVNGNADSSPLIMICAIFFMAAGALAVVFYVRLMLKQNKADAETDEDTEDTKETEAIEDTETEDVEAEETEVEQKEVFPETTAEDETKTEE